MNPLMKSVEETSVVHLDNRMSVLIEHFQEAIQLWSMMKADLLKLKDFYYFQSDYLSKHMSELARHQFWQGYAVSKDFQQFEAMLTFAKRVFFINELWAEIIYIESVRFLHYRMKHEYELYQDSAGDPFAVPDW